MRSARALYIALCAAITIGIGVGCALWFMWYVVLGPRYTFSYRRFEAMVQEIKDLPAGSHVLPESYANVAHSNWVHCPRPIAYINESAEHGRTYLFILWRGKGRNFEGALRVQPETELRRGQNVILEHSVHDYRIGTRVERRLGMNWYRVSYLWD